MSNQHILGRTRRLEPSTSPIIAGPLSETGDLAVSPGPKFWEDIEPLSALPEFILGFRHIIGPFRKWQVGSKIDTIFRRFDIPPVKSKGGLVKCLSRHLGEISMLPVHVLDFRCVAPFRNQCGLLRNSQPCGMRVVRNCLMRNIDAECVQYRE